MILIEEPPVKRAAFFSYHEFFQWNRITRILSWPKDRQIRLIRTVIVAPFVFTLNQALCF